MQATLRRAVSNALVARGFRRSRGTHVKPLGADFSLIVDTGPLDGFGDIDPWVGLQHRGIEELKAKLMELPLDQSSATVGSNVGQILDRRYSTWSGLVALDEVMADIDRASTRLAAFANLERLPEAFEIPGTAPLGVYNIAPVHLYRRDRANAERALERGEAQCCFTGSLVCDQFQQFARNARAFLESA